MLRWLFKICGRLMRQTDHESGGDFGIAAQPGMLWLGAADRAPVAPALVACAPCPETAKPAPPARSQFMLAARIASSNALNPPVDRAAAAPARVSSTKPTPKATAMAPRKASLRRQVLIVPQPPKKPTARNADIVRLAPRHVVARPNRLSKAA